MKIIKQNYKKLFGIALILNMIWLSVIGVLVLSQTTTTFTISEGVYPSALSFTFWREGNDYFAKSDYGRIYNWGETTNASELVLSALNTLSSTGGSLFFVDDIFEFDTTISITVKNVTLTGTGKGTILKAEDNANLEAIIKYPEQDDASGDSRVYGRIDNMRIDGNKQNNGADYGIFLNQTNWVDLSRLYINNCEVGVYLYGTSDNKHDGTWHVLLTENMFGGYEGNNTINIKGEFAHQVIVDSNILEDSVYSISLNRCKQWVISNNEIDDSYEYGILLYNLGDAYQYMCVIDGNTISDTVMYHDIYVGASVWNVIISNNDLFDDYQQALNGIHVRGRYVTITGNIIRNMYGYGIHTEDKEGISPYYITISNNIIWNCLDYGIRNEANHTAITGNVIKNCSRPVVNYNDYVTISNNIFEDCTNPCSFTGTVEQIVKFNVGYTTENSGSATVTTGTAINHLLDGTPTYVDVTFSVSEDIWVTAVGSSTFTVNFDGGGSQTFYWYAEFKP